MASIQPGKVPSRRRLHFGDAWSHTVKLEKIAPGIQGETNILLIDAEGRCPPEDCGGAPGYEDLLGILADPDHEETLTWCGGRFDPARADRLVLEGSIERLARRWAPRSKAKS